MEWTHAGVITRTSHIYHGEYLGQMGSERIEDTPVDIYVRRSHEYLSPIS